MPAMTGFTLAAAASIAVGLSVGFATTVGVTLAVAEHGAAPVRGRPALPIPSAPVRCNMATGASTGTASPDQGTGAANALLLGCR